MEIQRISSLDRFLNTIHDVSAVTTQDNVQSIINWWKKYSTLKKVQQNLLSIQEHIQLILNTLKSIENVEMNFQVAQELLLKEEFGEKISKFLSFLPRDPSLKSRNKQVKSVRFLSSAFMIQRFPFDVLQDNESPDHGPEAESCRKAANLLVFAFKRLCRSLQSSFKGFRVALIGYRFCVRNFLECLDRWKITDQERSQKYYEISYMDAIAIQITTQRHLANLNSQIESHQQGADHDEQQLNQLIHDRDHLAILAVESTSKINQFRSILQQLMGKQRFDNRIEEIEAYVKASVDEAFDERNAISALPTSPRPFPPSSQTSINGGSVVSLTPSASLSSSTTTAPPVQMTRERFQLEKVSTFTGLHPNYILYELSLDPTYTLPLTNLQRQIQLIQNQTDFLSSSPPLKPEDMNMLLRSNPITAATMLKEQMLRIMGDRLIGALLLSSLQDYQELTEGSVIILWYGSELPPPSPPSSGHNNQNNGSWIPAKVLNIDRENEVLDAEYHTDGIIERNISFRRVKLQSHGRDFFGSGFLQTISDLLHKIAEITSNKEFQSRVLNSVDFPQYQQMIEHHAIGVSEILSLLDTIVYLICDMQSEIRKKEYQQWYQEITLPFRYLENLSFIEQNQLFNRLVLFLPIFFEMVMTRIDELQLEISNFYLSMLGQYSLQMAPEILQQVVIQINSLKGGHGSGNAVLESVSNGLSLLNFTDSDYSTYLPKTSQFLCSNLTINSITGEFTDDLKEFLTVECNVMNNNSLIDIGHNPHLDVSLVAKAFCHLLQVPFDLRSSQGSEILPETLQWEAERLSILRNQIDSLAVISTLLLTIKQFLLMRKCRLTVDDEALIHLRLQELITSDHITLLHLVDDIHLIIQNIFQKQNIQFNTATQEILQNSIKQSVNSTNPVLLLVTKRIYKLIVKGLLSLPFQDLLTSFSFQSKQQINEVRGIIMTCKRVFDHSVMIFGPLYSAILRVRAHSLRNPS